MRNLVLAALFLTGCSAAGGGSLVPVRAVGSVAGDMSGPQVFIAGMPVNALLKVHGDLTYTVQPFPPYLTYDGSWNYIIEPVPGREAEAQAAVQRGDILIRHAGVVGTLNAPGSIAGYKAALMQMYGPKPQPSPEPVACTGPECAIPQK